MFTLRFPMAGVARLADHSSGSTSHCPSPEQLAAGISAGQPALEWVKDSGGTYLLSNGRPPLLHDPANPESNVAVHADGWSEGTRQELGRIEEIGGDDFAIHLQLGVHLAYHRASLLDAICGTYAAGAEWLLMHLHRDGRITFDFRWPGQTTEGYLSDLDAATDAAIDALATVSPITLALDPGELTVAHAALNETAQYAGSAAHDCELPQCCHRKAAQLAAVLPYAPRQWVLDYDSACALLQALRRASDREAWQRLQAAGQPAPGPGEYADEDAYVADVAGDPFPAPDSWRIDAEGIACDIAAAAGVLWI